MLRILLLILAIGCIGLSGCIIGHAKLTPEIQASLPPFPRQYREKTILVITRHTKPEDREALEFRNWTDAVAGYQQGPPFRRAKIVGWIWQVEINGTNPRNGKRTGFKKFRFLLDPQQSLYIYEPGSHAVLVPF